MDCSDRSHVEDSTAAHLPLVSVFMVLLAMLAALFAQAPTTSDAFDVLRPSLEAQFGAFGGNEGPQKLELSPMLVEGLEKLCVEFEIECAPYDSLHQSGWRFKFPQGSVDAIGRGLTTKEEALFARIMPILVPFDAVMVFNLPQGRFMDHPNISVLRTLVIRTGFGAERIVLRVGTQPQAGPVLDIVPERSLD